MLRKWAAVWEPGTMQLYGHTLQSSPAPEPRYFWTRDGAVRFLGKIKNDGNRRIVDTNRIGGTPGHWMIRKRGEI